jgi:hypothetical protein
MRLEGHFTPKRILVASLVAALGFVGGFMFSVSATPSDAETHPTVPAHLVQRLESLRSELGPLSERYDAATNSAEKSDVLAEAGPISREIVETMRKIADAQAVAVGGGS